MDLKTTYKNNTLKQNSFCININLVTLITFIFSIKVNTVHKYPVFEFEY